MKRLGYGLVLALLLTGGLEGATLRLAYHHSPTVWVGWTEQKELFRKSSNGKELAQLELKGNTLNGYLIEVAGKGVELIEQQGEGGEGAVTPLQEGVALHFLGNSGDPTSRTVTVQADPATSEEKVVRVVVSLP